MYGKQPQLNYCTLIMQNRCHCLNIEYCVITVSCKMWTHCQSTVSQGCTSLGEIHCKGYCLWYIKINIQIFWHMILSGWEIYKISSIINRNVITERTPVSLLDTFKPLSLHGHISVQVYTPGKQCPLHCVLYVLQYGTHAISALIK